MAWPNLIKDFLDVQIIQNACFWQWRKFQVTHSTCSKVIDEKYRQSVCSAVCYFAVNIPLVFHNCIHFRSRSRPIFYGSGSDSGSEQTVSVAPAPAPTPTKMCRLRRLRLRLRLRIPDDAICQIKFRRTLECGSSWGIPKYVTVSMRVHIFPKCSTRRSHATQGLTGTKELSHCRAPVPLS